MTQSGPSDKEQETEAGGNVTFAEYAIKLLLRPRCLRGSLERDDGDTGGAATAVVLSRLMLVGASRTYESGAKIVGLVSRLSGGLRACGASYPDLWLTDKRANLSKDLLKMHESMRRTRFCGVLGG